MPNNTNINTAAAIVNALTDTAFTPDMQEKTPLTADEKMEALFASMAADKVCTPVFANPANGEHNVVIYGYEYKNGYGDNGDYFSISLKDVDKNITWKMSLNAEPQKILAFLGEVNMYNNGIVFRMNPQQAFGKLQSKKFKVWTQQFDSKGQTRVKTYANPANYERFARYLASQSAK